MEKTFLGKEDEGLDTAGNPAPVARQQGTSEDSKDSEGQLPAFRGQLDIHEI